MFLGLGYYVFNDFNGGFVKDVAHGHSPKLRVFLYTKRETLSRWNDKLLSSLANVDHRQSVELVSVGSLNSGFTLAGLVSSILFIYYLSKDFFQKMFWKISTRAARLFTEVGWLVGLLVGWVISRILMKESFGEIFWEIFRNFCEKFCKIFAKFFPKSLRNFCEDFVLKIFQFLDFGKMCQNPPLHTICIDVFSKYAWVVPLKNKKGPSLVEAFKIILASGRKPEKIITDQGTEFFNKHFKALLKDEDIGIVQHV